MFKHPGRFLALALPLLTLSLSGATLARSANSTTVGAFTLTANYNTIQFKLAYTGDDNQSATVFVRYWKTGSPANSDTAVVPVRDLTEPRLTGVIFWLEENTAYTVEVTISDPDGLADRPNPSTLTQSITTRDSATPGTRSGSAPPEATATPEHLPPHPNRRSPLPWQS